MRHPAWQALRTDMLVTADTAASEQPSVYGTPPEQLALVFHEQAGFSAKQRQIAQELVGVPALGH